jgi:hypothetical protein
MTYGSDWTEGSLGYMAERIEGANRALGVRGI